MHLAGLLVVGVSLVLFAQSLFSLYLMLYTWEHPERLEAGRGPSVYLPPHYSFTVLLPARHEEAVIYATIRRVWAATYPKELLEIVVVCHADDHGTIAEAQRAIDALGSERIRVETFVAPPINKPHGLNVGFQRSSNEIVTIFDAEDDVHPDIFNVVNTVMLEEEVGIVQAGVQLMNFRDHWFAVHNCLEYFFWFKSRLHYHADVGMIPLGGNTIFARRELVARAGGWDEQCLTEDADIGIRLSVLGERIRVVYDARHATREETPDGVASFVRQRTRWQQGFLQVLRKRSWLDLPRLDQRLLALYTLSYPLFQGLLALFWPVAVGSILWLKLPVLSAMVSFLPLYALGFQLVATVVGAVSFARDYELAFPLFLPIEMAVTFLPFQWLLGLSALRAIYRELRVEHDWEKTSHLGAHRRAVASPAFGQLLTEAATRLGAEVGTVLILDEHRRELSVVATYGLTDEGPHALASSIHESLVARAIETGEPVVVRDQLPQAGQAVELGKLRLCSAVAVPLRHEGTVVAVVGLGSAQAGLPDDAASWLHSRLSELSIPHLQHGAADGNPSRVARSA